MTASRQLPASVKLFLRSRSKHTQNKKDPKIVFADPPMSRSPAWMGSNHAPPRMYKRNQGVNVWVVWNPIALPVPRLGKEERGRLSLTHPSFPRFP